MNITDESPPDLNDATPPPSHTTVPQTAGAPHGHFPDGRPRKRAPRGTGPARAAAKPRARPAQVDFTQTFHQLLLGVSALLGFLGQRSGSAPLVADAYVVRSGSDVIAPAANKLLQEYPALVARLTVVSKVTPATEFATAILPVVLVILSNHNVIDGPDASEVLKAYAPTPPPATDS